MTKKLFYQDAFLKEFSAVVLEIAEQDLKEKHTVRIRLDQTAFYPEGGGQGADHGSLILPDGQALEVTDVQELDGEIWHTVSRSAGTSELDNQEQSHGQNLVEPMVCPGTQVTGQIDWKRRFDHMQQHSGEHIVSGMICARFHCDNVGFHLGEDVVTIDFNHRITMEEAEEIEEQANRYIWENHPLQILWPTPEELQSLTYRSKKELEGDVRIACFPGADTCACCGTHVTSSAQVGLVKFLSAKNFHEGTRLELLCGRRAARFLSMNYHENKATAVLLSSKEEQTAAHVARLIEENIRLKSECTAAKEQLLRMRAEACKGKGDVCVIDDTLDPEQARPLADLIADSCGGRAAVFVKDGAGYRYAVIQRNADITDFIKNMNQSLQGRGGGRNGFAQGAVNAGKHDIQDWFTKA